MLAVLVHRQHPVAAAGRHARERRRVLPVVPAEPEGAHPGVLLARARASPWGSRPDRCRGPGAPRRRPRGARRSCRTPRCTARARTTTSARVCAAWYTGTTTESRCVGVDRGTAGARHATTIVVGRCARDPLRARRPQEESRVHENTSATPPGPPTEPPAGMHGEPGPLFRLVRDQRVAFLIIGGINTLMGTALVRRLPAACWATASGRTPTCSACGCAHVCAVLTAFVLYRRFVFRVRGHVWAGPRAVRAGEPQCARHQRARAPVRGPGPRLAPIPAQLLVTCVTALISYFGHRDFSFRRTSAERAAGTCRRPSRPSPASVGAARDGLPRSGAA